MIRFLQTKIATGESMQASDMLNLVFFPKGTILMYDGTSWADNVTLKGWYQCKGGTVNGLTIPDLRDKFIMGYNSGDRTGGVNSQALTLGAINLPAHGHTLKDETINITGGSHNHPFKNESITSGGAHSHGISTSTTDKTLTGNFKTKVVITSTSSAASEGINFESAAGILSRTYAASVLEDPAHGELKTSVAGYRGISVDATHSHTGTASNESPAHTHAINLNGKSTADSTTHTHTLNLNGKSTNTSGSGTPYTFDNRPNFYALIYIIKVTNAGE